VRESIPERRLAGKSKLTVAELAADLMFEGPGDLSTNPKYMNGFGEPNRPVKSKRGST
jgi:hypothetical protein